ncbi:MAG: Hydrogenase maturation factor HypC [Phycisphaerae bacterium]|nr:Hydrogenase maturation factor HypC [Phycisphaerae bacterium]
MCLAMPGQIVQAAARGGNDAVVDMNGNRFTVSTVMTPEARVGDWVLVHAGFAIAKLDENDARETWDLLREAGIRLE